MTSCREAALNYSAVLVFGSPEAAVTGAAGAGAQEGPARGLVWFGQLRVQLCVCRAVWGVLLHTGS